MDDDEPLRACLIEGDDVVYVSARGAIDEDILQFEIVALTLTAQQARDFANRLLLCANALQKAN